MEWKIVTVEKRELFAGTSSRLQKEKGKIVTNIQKAEEKINTETAAVTDKEEQMKI